MIKEFKQIIKGKGKEFAKDIGLTYDSFRTLTKNTVKVIPKWVISFMIGYKLGKDKKDYNG